MKEVIKNKTKKIGIIILIILLPIFIYLLIDGKNLYVDMYNFKQLEKAKPILDSISDNDKKFYSLKEFNQKYNANIKPIKNCYYIRKINGEYPYIFGFKLESYIYIYIYGNEYYAYPKYDIEEIKNCVGGNLICNEEELKENNFPYVKPECYSNYECFDGNKKIFEETISSLCRE